MNYFLRCLPIVAVIVFGALTVLTVSNKEKKLSPCGGNYSADTLIPSSSKESEYGVVWRASVFLCGFHNGMKVHECVGTEV